MSYEAQFLCRPRQKQVGGRKLCRKKDVQDTHVRGPDQKEQRGYEHLKESAEKSGRYGDRTGEVATRTVLKHHEEEHHRPGE